MAGIAARPALTARFEGMTKGYESFYVRAVDPATGSALVRLLFSKPTRLPTGTPVQVKVLGTEHHDAVLVPAAAIVRA